MTAARPPPVDRTILSHSTDQMVQMDQMDQMDQIDEVD